MQNKWTIIHDDEQAKQERKTCFYCERFFCTEYHDPACRMVCSGILPQWEWLYWLMRNVKATDTCNKFVLHKIFQKRSNDGGR